MKLFDVMVFDPKQLQDKVYKTGLAKGEAKRLVNQLKNSGFKAQLATCKNRVETISLNLEDSFNSNESD